MKKYFLVVTVLVTLISGIITGNEMYNTYWPSWRGPLLTGESPKGDPPTEWSEQKNIRWKISLPGKGMSTPVIWGNQIFLTTAVPTDKAGDPEKVDSIEKSQAGWMRRSGRSRASKFVNRFIVFSINRKDGKVIWQTTVKEELPHAGTHKDGSWASASCSTDGEYVIAFFGSYGLYCFDMKGSLVWEKDFGKMNIRMSFGEGSSPVLYGNAVIVNWDHEGQSFIVMLDKRTGKEVWKKDRNERTSWATPAIFNVNGREQIVVAATGKSRGYDLKTGDVIWELGGMTANVIPTPVYADGIVYLMSGFRGSAMQAVRLEKAKGNIENTEAVVWTSTKDAPYTPSSLLYKNTLYFLKGNKELLTCADALTGTIHYAKQKLEGMNGVYASPVAAKDRIYLAGRNGIVYVLKHGLQFEVIAKNMLDDRFDASPAVVERELYLRGLNSLYCISIK